jgi:hypothetical protein
MSARGMSTREIVGHLRDLYGIDALRVKIRDEGLVRNKAVHIALAVRADGTNEILGTVARSKMRVPNSGCASLLWRRERPALRAQPSPSPRCDRRVRSAGPPARTEVNRPEC